LVDLTKPKRVIQKKSRSIVFRGAKAVSPEDLVEEKKKNKVEVKQKQSTELPDKGRTKKKMTRRKRSSDMCRQE